MRVHGKKLTALLLAACMLLGLAACGSENGDSADQLSGTVYVPEFVDMDLDLEYVNSGCSDGSNAYLVGEIVTYMLRDAEGQEVKTLTQEEAQKYWNGELTTEDGSYADSTYRYAIFRVSLESGEAAELENYEPVAIPEGYEGNSYISDIRMGADGTIWITEQLSTYKFDLPADFDPENDDQWNYYTSGEDTQIQRQLDSTGNELSRVDTSGLTEKLDMDYINNMVIDPSGNFIVSGQKNTETTSETKITALDKDMNKLFEISEEDLWGQLILLGDGSVGVITSYNDLETNTYKRVMKTVDVAAKGWGEEYTLPQNAYTAYTGSDKYLFYYDNNDSLYGYNKDTGEGEKILAWSSADINKNDLMFFSFLEDGRVVAMTRSWRGSGVATELAVLTEQPASVLADKTILTYATMYLDYDVRNRIIDFNKSNTKYRIEIRDYSEYNTDTDATAGLTKLNVEIGAGNLPDILDTSNMPITQYGAKGILEDLWPYIDNDPDLGREALMENVFKAAEQDGKLYQIFSNFSIQTVGGAPSVVGDRLSWTLEDMKAALASMPEGCMLFSEGNTKSDMLRTVISQNLSGFVDWDSGKCSFNSENFISMLEFCNSFPAEYDWSSVDWEEYEDEPTRIQSGKQMLSALSLYDFQSIQMYKAMFGGSVSFVGYPMEDGSVGSTFSIGNGMAMSTKCKDKDGAWAFMREMLLPQDEEDSYHYYGNFPTNKSEFEKMAAENMKADYQLDENGNPVLDEHGNKVEISHGGWGWGDLQINIYATTQEEYDQIMELYNSITSIYEYDDKIFDIVNEVAASYFNGDKTVEDTANLIQSRVELYVNESK